MQLYKNQSTATAVISPSALVLFFFFLLLRSGGLSALCSGCRFDKCVLACTGISAACRNLHSDVKGSTQLPVSTENYEVSLWAAGPRERPGSGADQRVLTVAREEDAGEAGVWCLDCAQEVLLC